MELEASIPAIEIIKELEELKLEAYTDGASISIGYGHSNTSGGEQFQLGDTITEEKADELLEKDLEEIERIVNQRLKNYGLTFNQTQFDVTEEPTTTSTTTSTTSTTMPEQDEEIDTESRSEGITNMFGTPPQDFPPSASKFYDLAISMMEKQVNKQRQLAGLQSIKKAEMNALRNKYPVEEALKILGGR